MMKESVQTEVKLVEAPSSSYSESPRVDTFQLHPGLVLATSFLLVWAIAAVFYAQVPKHIQKLLFKLQPHHKVPCRDCKFFNCNPYIQCAIHPTTVQTMKAADCQDYRDKSE